MKQAFCEHCGQPLKPEKKLNWSYIKSEEIIEFISQQLEIPRDDLNGKSRKEEYIRARSICYKMLKEDKKLSYRAIGNLFGARTHATALNGHRGLNNWFLTKPQEKEIYDDIRNSFIKLVTRNPYAMKSREELIELLEQNHNGTSN